MIEESVATIFAADSELQAMIGDRLYPLVRPQGDPLPAVVTQRTAIVPVSSLTGDSGMDRVRMRFSCYDKTLLGAKRLAEVVRRAIAGSALLQATTEMMLEEQDPETKNFRVILDFNIWERK